MQAGRALGMKCEYMPIVLIGYNVYCKAYRIFDLFNLLTLQQTCLTHTCTPKSLRKLLPGPELGNYSRASMLMKMFLTGGITWAQGGHHKTCVLF
eukprot:563752-Pelagomonas_calceolata.AAC.1